MPDRFYCPDLPENGTVALPPEEAHHACSVLRMKQGDALILFDGAGHEASAHIVASKKKSVEAEIESRQEINRESRRALTIAVALPKGDRQKWLIEKCVELGAARILPLDVQRCVAKPEKQVVERLQRQVIEASKQCRRNALMQILEPMNWAAFLQSVSAGAYCQKWIAHPGGKTVSQLLKESPEEGNFLAAVGPEGGFTEEECAQAIEAGFIQASLGARILRIETAAVSLAAQVCN